jgi:hypothetical protein
LSFSDEIIYVKFFVSFYRQRVCRGIKEGKKNEIGEKKGHCQFLKVEGKGKK